MAFVLFILKCNMSIHFVINIIAISISQTVRMLRLINFLKGILLSSGIKLWIFLLRYSKKVFVSINVRYIIRQISSKYSWRRVSSIKNVKTINFSTKTFIRHYEKFQHFHSFILCFLLRLNFAVKFNAQMLLKFTILCRLFVDFMSCLLPEWLVRCRCEHWRN